MSSREKILKAIRQAQLKEVALPGDAPVLVDKGNLLDEFTTVLTNIGGKVLVFSKEMDMETFIRDEYEGLHVVNGIDGWRGYNLEDFVSHTAAEMDEVEVVMLRGGVGIAENGAIWLTERNMKNRLLPFICKELVLVIDVKNMVANMHEAYEKIRVAEDGYGVFIAGPSKTADIEQSLVVGAHGPLALSVCIMV